ncbi:hypothetical protein F8O01_13870 [Pseudoclavibacter chungangensis]|uniref:Zinc ribbon domain-containing protein n=1 Tax=Pseudoclavibacter chungangensis TaxID=587635 RepID=A0A7J5BRA9_9MICO|nr:DUF6320 domain-containing protein [Pseudoclavibacter chungangensis]KAB1654316.1 hypothetical protein F8O01_13870 [Pseudoclavibacter chungangensis]NYJ65274.1 hypothetical protein [Pseudoclavibacter chungangensis]
MTRCDACRAEVEGEWRSCPLCGGVLHGTAVADPFPAVPLAFSRRRVLSVLLLVSVVAVAASFAVQWLFGGGPDAIGWWRFVWLGVASMWIIVLLAVRKRRDPAKGTAYLVVVVGLVCAYWDLLTGWHRWSTTYAIPIVCGAAIIALLIVVRVMRTEVGDYIVYSGLTVLLGLVPAVFLLFRWTTNPWASVVCVLFSVFVLVLMRVFRGREVRHELAKRFHV